MTYDNDTLDYFLEHQLQLFPEEVASTREEADEFLDECFATVCKNVKEVREYLDDVADITGMSDSDIINCEEVFSLPNGRYLVLDV